jgi:hypothetical protein
MGIGTILLLVGIVGLLMALFWIVSRPPSDFAARDDG